MKILSVEQSAALCKEASKSLMKTSIQERNGFLKMLAEKLKDHEEAVLEANRQDIEEAKAKGLSAALIDRLSLDKRLEGIIEDILHVRDLPDPLGVSFEEKALENGLLLSKCRTSIGVLGVIYESRPNVTVDISALAIKSGNAALLRGGSETLKTNEVLVRLIQESLCVMHLPADAIRLITSPDREEVAKLLRLNEYIDLIIPRGGAALQNYCKRSSSIPVITGGIGICHLFVDETADLTKSLDVILNAKTQRPTVCNALDTLLVHEKVAGVFIPQVVKKLAKQQVEFRLDEASLHWVGDQSCKRAQEKDWDTEWMSLILGIKVVKNLSEAIDHIERHSSGHSDGILTEDAKSAERFLREVDSAVVYHNASTRFTDGGQFGLGGEVAVSTQKFHARGPMGLNELTSYKWIVRGNYQVRK